MFRCNKISAGILIILGLIFTLLFLSYDTQSKEPSRISKILLGRPIKVLDEFEKKNFQPNKLSNILVLLGPIALVSRL